MLRPDLLCAVAKAALCAAFTLLPGSSQVTHVSYWQAQFAFNPDEVVHSASYYGVAEASHYLAEYYWRRNQRARSLSFYRLAVTQGDAGAAYALSQRVPGQRQHWIREASELGDPRAILALAKQIAEQEPAAAIEMLMGSKPSQRRDRDLAELLFNHPWLNTSQLDWYSLIRGQSDWRFRRFAAHQLATTGLLALRPHRACTVVVTLHTSGGNSRTQLYTWLEQLSQHPLAELDLCFAEVLQPAACDKDEQGRAYCTPAIHQVDNDRKLAYAGSLLIGAQGSANTRNRDIHISENASFEVFLHELGHMLRLADEYPMSPDLAQAFCSGQYDFTAINIVITHRDKNEWSRSQLEQWQQKLPWQEHLQQAIAQPIVPDDSTQIMYRLGSLEPDKVGLFPVATCEGTEYQAWRPVKQMTFMQQHESGKVPGVYIELMRQHLADLQNND